jgi:hypothetical protein
MPRSPVATSKTTQCELVSVKYAWLVTRMLRPRNCALVGVSHGTPESPVEAGVCQTRFQVVPRCATSTTVSAEGPAMAM